MQCITVRVQKCNRIQMGRTVQTCVVIIMEYCSKLMKVEVVSCFWKKLFPLYGVEYREKRLTISFLLRPITQIGFKSRFMTTLTFSFFSFRFLKTKLENLNMHSVKNYFLPSKSISRDQNSEDNKNGNVGSIQYGNVFNCLFTCGFFYLILNFQLGRNLYQKCQTEKQDIARFVLCKVRIIISCLAILCDSLT